MLVKYECLMQNHYGSRFPAAFCDKYQDELRESGCGALVDVILEADDNYQSWYNNGTPLRFDLDEVARNAWESLITDGVARVDGLPIGVETTGEEAVWNYIEDGAVEMSYSVEVYALDGEFLGSIDLTLMRKAKELAEAISALGYKVKIDGDDYETN